MMNPGVAIPDTAQTPMNSLMAIDSITIDFNANHVKDSARWCVGVRDNGIGYPANVLG